MSDSAPQPAESDTNELTRFVRSTTALEVLCLLLVGLVLMWSPRLFDQRRNVLVLMGAFAIAIILFRARRFFPRQTRAKLAIESMSLVLFISGVLWFTGKSQSPLLNLYLLPIVLSALTLGRVFTLIQVFLIFIIHMLLASADAAVDVFSFVYASRVVGELAPFLLVAYLTTTLSADITEARQSLENLTQTDPLTGILNLRAFNESWQRQHKLAERNKGQYGLLMIDIDKLKGINDTYGHDAGNSAIVLVSQCLQRCIRASDFLARISGNEFAVLLTGATPDVAEVVVKRMRNNVYNTTLDLRSRMIRCSISVGVVNYPKDARDTRELMNLSERRMDRDKELRRAPDQPATA